MAKAHQDPVNWPYAPPNFYPQHRSYNLQYAQGRVCQESCCRRTRGPLPYPPPLPPLPPSLPCRSSQENAYARAPSSQSRGFIPVNPYMQQHGGHPQHPQAAGVHRPIPQGRYDYNDFYRYGSSTNNSNNHQGFHPTHPSVLKQNVNSYSVTNSTHVTEQYPACSHYTPAEQETPLPSLDVRQFLATWQDKDEEVFENEQQQKSKVQFQEQPSNPDVFKPLDCTKRNEPSIPLYGYNHNQINTHPSYYNKPLQGVPNHQSINENAFKNGSYIPANSYHALPVENNCNFNGAQVNMSPHNIVENDSQHAGYERRIEKIFNPHSCKTLPAVQPNNQPHCAVDKGPGLDIKAPLSEKTQYHLSASLECEDLFDDINRKREERQRHIVHPLCYQENYPQRMNGNMRSKSEIPHVSVKPNTATHLNYPVDNFGGPIGNIDNEMDLKKSKSLPLKKWVQKRKKSEDEFFPPFNFGELSLDSGNRDTVIERSHVQPSCEPNMSLNTNDNPTCDNNIPEIISHAPTQGNLSNELSVPNFSNTMTASEKSSNDCVYSSIPEIPQPENQVANLSNITNSTDSDETLNKNISGNEPSLSISSDDIDISLVSSCDLVAGVDQHENNQSMHQNYLLLEGSNGNSVEQAVEKEGDDKCDKVDDNCLTVDSDLLPSEILGEVNDTMDKKGDPTSPTSSNALKTIAYMYDDENNVSENSLDASLIGSKSKMNSSNSKQKNNNVPRNVSVKYNRVLALWRYRNRLFRKSLVLKKTPLIVNNSKYKTLSKTRCWREFSKFCCIRKRKICGNSKTNSKQADSVVQKQESKVVNVVLSSLVDGVCQIGEISSQVEDQNDARDIKPSEPGVSVDNHCNSSNDSEGKSNLLCWELASSDEKVTSTVESDTTEEEESNLVISEEYIGYAEGTMVDGPDDRVLHGILNWPHHEEEITSVNEKESIKVSLPWVKIFKPHSDLPDREKTLEIGPARIELRYSPAPIEYQPGHFKASRNNVAKKSSIFSVKKVLLKHNAGPPTERLPKMVIKKTGCEEYKSYIKDAKLRVISIKNSNKDGQAEVIIEADGPLIGGSISEDDSSVTENGNSSQEIPQIHKDSQELADPENTDPSPETANELHHCLLCQESFTSLEKLRTHENSLSHRHIDIIQRNVLHKLQKTLNGAEFPEFQPLSATEIEYLNWKPNFSGYNHFYHNVPL